MTDSMRIDGRDSRWAEHRNQRRRELTEAAIAAIRQHGATVGMDEIAAIAGTSKTVIYRHLGDRLGLYLAVCEAVDAQILSNFRKALGPTTSGEVLIGNQEPREVMVAVIDSYLRLVESDSEVYRFVVRRPLLNVPPDSDPVVGLTDTIAAALGAIFSEALTATDESTAPALTWAHGLVGFVRESADRWLGDPNRAPREEITQYLADFAAYGLTGVLHLNEQHTTPRH